MPVGDGVGRVHVPEVGGPSGMGCADARTARRGKSVREKRAGDVGGEGRRKDGWTEGGGCGCEDG